MNYTRQDKTRQDKTRQDTYHCVKNNIHHINKNYNLCFNYRIEA